MFTVPCVDSILLIEQERENQRKIAYLKNQIESKRHAVAQAQNQIQQADEYRRSLIHTSTQTQMSCAEMPTDNPDTSLSSSSGMPPPASLRDLVENRDEVHRALARRDRRAAEHIIKQPPLIVTSQMHEQQHWACQPNTQRGPPRSISTSVDEKKVKYRGALAMRTEKIKQNEWIIKALQEQVMREKIRVNRLKQRGMHPQDIKQIAAARMPREGRRLIGEIAAGAPVESGDADTAPDRSSSPAVRTSALGYWSIQDLQALLNQDTKFGTAWQHMLHQQKRLLMEEAVARCRLLEEEASCIKAYAGNHKNGLRHWKRVEAIIAVTAAVEERRRELEAQRQTAEERRRAQELADEAHQLRLLVRQAQQRSFADIEQLNHMRWSDRYHTLMSTEKVSREHIERESRKSFSLLDARKREETEAVLLKEENVKHNNCIVTDLAVQEELFSGGRSRS